MKTTIKKLIMKTTIKKLKSLIRETLQDDGRTVSGTEEEIDQSISHLDPDKIVDRDYMNSETGEIYLSKGEVARRSFLHPQNLKDREEATRKHRDETIEITSYDDVAIVDEFQEKYDVKLQDLSFVTDMGHAELATADYEDRSTPSEIKRKDGKPLSQNDIENIEYYLSTLEAVQNDVLLGKVMYYTDASEGSQRAIVSVSLA